MPIKYYLQPNHITPDPNDQTARVHANNVHDLEGILRAMLRRGTGTIEADMRAVLNLFFEVVTDEVADGNFVNLPIANIRPSISGVFATVMDNFDSNRHTKRASLSAGLLMQQKMQRASVEKILQPLPAPVVLEFMDVFTLTINDKITPGSIGSITGEELKFNAENMLEGIFFVDTKRKATRVGVVASRTEGKLMFSIPALPAGSYTLEVRKAYTAANTIRAGVLSDLLNVA